jgi:hypothetical protein
VWAGCLLIGAALLASPLLGGVASATPLTRPEVVKLIKKKVQEGRLFMVVRELGIDFKVTPEIADELRAAGASASLIAALQALVSGEETTDPRAVQPSAVAAPAPTAPAPAAPAPAAAASATAPTALSAPAPAPIPAPVVAPAVVAPSLAPVASAPPAVAPTPRATPAVAPPVPAAPPPTAPTGAAPGAVASGPEPAEAKEEARPVHPLEPPPAAVLPRGAAETMAALIPGPPPPPPPRVISPFLSPAAPESPVAVAVAPARPTPAPGAPAVAAPGPAPLAPEAAAETPNRWEVIRPLLEKASNLASEGDIRGAQTLVVKAMELDPGEPKVWKAFKGIEQDLLARAETFLADGQLQRAFREFQFVVTTNPDSALGFNGVGLALLSLKNYDEAVAAFEKALTLDPANARYRQALTRARSLQRASKALERQGQQNLKEMIEDQSGRKKGP